MSYNFDPNWSVRGTYMEQKHGVPTAEANEAFRDPSKVVFDPDPASKSGRGVRVIGKTARGRLLTVIVMPVSDVIHGVNGWDANSKDANVYDEFNREGR